MNYQLIKSTNSTNKMVLFFVGWGMDAHLFASFVPKNYDLLVIYNYSDLTFDDTILADYTELKVIAWSMGVWAASQLLQSKDYPINEKIAINGTHFPVDDEKGIPTIIAKGTLNNLNEATLVKFHRRMCGTSETLETFNKHKSTRNLNDLTIELKNIYLKAGKLAISDLSWNRIYVGNKDLIFAPQNQLNAWKNTTTTVVDEAHYPPQLFNHVLKTIFE